MTEAVSSLGKLQRGGNSFEGGRAAFILRVGTACHKEPPDESHPSKCSRIKYKME